MLLHNFNLNMIMKVHYFFKFLSPITYLFLIISVNYFHNEKYHTISNLILSVII